MATADGKRVALGDQVRDVVTGFEGIAVGLTDWLTGCRTISVKPAELKDGKPQDAVGLDEPQLVIVATNVVQVGDAGEPEASPPPPSADRDTSGVRASGRDRGGPHEAVTRGY